VTAGSFLCGSLVVMHDKVKNRFYVGLPKLSKEANEIAKKDDQKVLTKIRNEIDELVAELYGLSNKELQILIEQI